MGIYHFMGVGRAVGAVTCAIDYIEKALDLFLTNTHSVEVERLFQASGGIRHDEAHRGNIEAIVLFTSKEVIENTIAAFPYIGYEKPGMVRQELLRNLPKVWKRSVSHEGKKVFWCEVDIDNFQDCFNKIVKVAYRFSPPGKQGKEIWCNLTGGTNSIGLALLSMARWTGLSTKHYVISQRREFQKSVTVPAQISICPNKDEYFNLVPFIKTYIDTVNFYEVLMEVESLGKPVKSPDLLSRLKGKPQFFTLTQEEFKRHYMLKLYGLGYIDYNLTTDETVITESGRGFINELESLESVIDFEEELLQPHVDIVEASKQWEWFREMDIVE